MSAYASEVDAGGGTLPPCAPIGSRSPLPNPKLVAVFPTVPFGNASAIWRNAVLQERAKASVRVIEVGSGSSLPNSLPPNTTWSGQETRLDGVRPWARAA